MRCLAVWPFSVTNTSVLGRCTEPLWRPVGDFGVPFHMVVQRQSKAMYAHHMNKKISAHHVHSPGSLKWYNGACLNTSSATRRRTYDHVYRSLQNFGYRLVRPHLCVMKFLIFVRYLICFSFFFFFWYTDAKCEILSVSLLQSHLITMTILCAPVSDERGSFV